MDSTGETKEEEEEEKQKGVGECQGVLL